MTIQQEPLPENGLWSTKITKSFGKRPVLLGVKVGVRRGEVVGLLGPNGAGKTTLFSILSGILSPDGGRISLDGKDITHVPMYKRANLGIGYLPQDASIFRGLTVEQNIRAVLEISEPDPDHLEERLDELLEAFSISHLRESSAIALSGGERRRTELARALAINPSFLLLDEPLAGIDPIAVAEIRDIIKQMKALKIGVLITDHNVRETLDIVDRAYIIANGHVLMHGTPDEITAHPDVRRVYLGDSFSL
ncbi:MAG: LPS export ABC transporter ATP-binding protein [Alphaproteobacteria bacterium CG_4_10_14_0_8_um_filter_37_21]|nr:MAG: LPS export ABC transporter ATP-binding protein [Alphaproteobacteria bacterium CG_4_10_14_0_8_um_filter_37_21]